MTRGGTRAARDEPERRCIVQGTSGPKAGLIRFVAGPDDELVPDIAGRLPGRGFYVGAERSALETAVRRNAFDRAARRKLKVPPDLPDRVENLLARRVVELLALARKAGEAVAGFEKVRGILGSGAATVLLQARDGSPRQRARLRPPSGPASLIACLDASELGLAFGRENVIHAALTGGGLTARIVEEASRLAGLRGHVALSGAVPGDHAGGPSGVGK